MFESDVGLQNVQNTCYVNAVLQALKHTPAVAAFFTDHVCEKHKTCKKGEECIVCALNKCFCMIGKRKVAFKPEMILDKMGGILPHYVQGRQEDAHELITQLIGKVHDTFALSSEKLDFRGIFQATFFNVVRCQLCKTKSVRGELGLGLTLVVCDTIIDSINRFFKKESITGHHCDTCSTTGGPTTKECHLQQAPKVLLLRLTREAPGAKKIFVKVPERLRLATYSAERLREGTNAYTLTAMINHIGDTIDCGHYTTTTRTKSGGFRLFNDAVVSPTTLSAAGTQVYLVLYEKDDAGRVSDLSLESRPQDHFMIVEKTSDDVEMKTVVKKIPEESSMAERDEGNDSRPLSLSKVAIRKRKEPKSSTFSSLDELYPSAPTAECGTTQALETTLGSVNDIQSPQAIRTLPPSPQTQISVSNQSTWVKNQSIERIFEEPPMAEVGPRSLSKVTKRKRQNGKISTFSSPDTSPDKRSLSPISTTVECGATPVLVTPLGSVNDIQSPQDIRTLAPSPPVRVPLTPVAMQTMKRISEEPPVQQDGDGKDAARPRILSGITMRKRHKVKSIPGRISWRPMITSTISVRATSTSVSGRLPPIIDSSISPKISKGPKGRGGHVKRGRGGGGGGKTRGRKALTDLQRRRKQEEDEHRLRLEKQSRALQKRSTCDLRCDMVRDYRGCMHRLLEKHRLMSYDVAPGKTTNEREKNKALLARHLMC